MLARAFGHVPRGSTLLDVACGTGRLAAVLQSIGGPLTGVDASLPMLAAARAHGLAGVRWVAGDATALPFAAKSFDVLVSTRFLRHLDAGGRLAVFRELARVARRFVVVELLLGAGLVWRVKQLVHDAGWNRDVGARRPSHEGLVRELESAGLRFVARHALLAGVSQPHVYVCEVARSG